MLLFAKRLWKDDLGAIISAELTLILTLTVIGIVVGLTSVSSSVNAELADVGSAFGAINQSYSFSGLALSRGNFGGAVIAGGNGGGAIGIYGGGGGGGSKAFVAGSGFWDQADFCDCSEVIFTGSNIKFDGISGGVGGGIPADVPHRKSAPPTAPAPIDSPCEEEPCDLPCTEPPCQGLGNVPLVPSPDSNVPRLHTPLRVPSKTK